MEVRTRTAPSPTGNLHLGTAYATLWPYLFARKNDGVFIVRIEDTDLDRSTKDFEQSIIEGFKWLGFDWDEGPFYQMERMDLYASKLNQLLTEGKAYRCFCTKDELDFERKSQAAAKKPQVYSGKCRDLSEDEIGQKMQENISFVVRFKMPDDRGVIEYNDMIHGLIKFDSRLIGDFVISRTSGVPLYNFVVVVDDMEMKVSHVIRGDDHVSNTPKQVVLFEAFGCPPPEYGHYAVILENDRSGKLSKRTGATGIDWYKSEGYLPEAVLNYLFLLGVSVPDGEEIYSKEEMVSYFDIQKMINHPAAWNQQKLDWVNGEYIRNLSVEELTDRLVKFLVDHPKVESIAPMVPLVQERMKKLSDFVALTDWFYEGTEYDIEVFDGLKIENLETVLISIIGTLEKLGVPWEKQAFESALIELAQKSSISNLQLFQLLRVAYAGQLVTPPLFEIMVMEGEEKSLARLNKGLEFVLECKSL